VIGDINDFPDQKHLAIYFGIVPRVANPNETERSGRIHKRGTKLGRTALVQSALVAAKYSPYLKRFHEQVKVARSWESDYRPGTEVPGYRLSDFKKQVGV
jgi:transposase